MTLSAGTVLGGDFRIESDLASGGMGDLYIATQISTNRRRALKVMRAELVSTEKHLERFILEAQVGARIESEHVVEIVAAGQDAATRCPYLVMELLEGETLRQAVEKRGALPRSEVIELFKQLCHAVGAAHAAHVVHRDLKPDNIFLSRSRRAGGNYTVKVLDFGIAKVVQDLDSTSRKTAALGTPMFMAPEQADQSAAIGPHTDVWALGMVAFYALAGRPYWVTAANGGGPQSVVRELLFDPLVAASERARVLGGTIPAAFDAWFVRAVARDPGKRFSSIVTLLENLVYAMDASDAPAAPTNSHATLVSGGTSAAAVAKPQTVAATQLGEPIGGLTQFGPPVAPPVSPPTEIGFEKLPERVLAIAIPAPARRKPAPVPKRALMIGAAAVAALSLLVVALRCNGSAENEETEEDEDAAATPNKRVPPAERAPVVKVELYAMSQCRYAAQTARALAEARSQLGPIFSLKLELIGNAEGGQLTSLHGPEEVEGDRVFACAEKTSPYWLDLMICSMADPTAVTSAWRACAGTLQIPVAPIEKCMAGESSALLEASFARAASAQIKGSPTVIIDGRRSTGAMTADKIKLAVCDAHPSPKPATCQ